MTAEIFRGIDPQTGEDVGGKVGTGTRTGCDRNFASCSLRANLKSPDYGPTCWARNLDGEGQVIYGQVYCGKDPLVERWLQSG